MRECKHVRRWMAQSLGGDLSPGEAARLKDHLKRCGSCREAFAAAREATTALSDFAARWPRATLSEEARANLKQQVRERGKQPRPKGRGALVFRLRGWAGSAVRLGRASPRWALGVLLALVVGLGGLIWHSRGVLVEPGPRGAGGDYGTITGVVRGVDHDRPLAGATVVAYTPEQFESVKPFFTQWNLAEFKKANWGIQGRVLLARTDRQGRYTLASVPRGTYIVCVFWEEGAYPRTETIRVFAGQPTKTMEFKVGERLPGSLTIRVRRPDETPLPHASVSVVLTTAHSVSRFGGQTDAQGRYGVPIPADGTYEVAVAVEGYPLLKRSDVRLRQGEAPEELDFTLATPAPQTVVLSGQVFLPDGKTPAAEVAVAPFTKDLPFPGANATFTGTQGTFHLRTRPILTTDAEGNFRLAGLPPGRYGVVAAPYGFSRGKEGAGPDRERLFLLPAASEWIEARAEGETRVVLVLGRGGALTGAVRDCATHQPVAGATVRLSPRPARTEWLAFLWTRPVQTDAQGTFWFPGLPVGVYSVDIQAAGYEPYSLEADVAAGETRKMEVMLRRAPSERDQNGLPRRGTPGEGRNPSHPV